MNKFEEIRSILQKHNVLDSNKKTYTSEARAILFLMNIKTTKLEDAIRHVFSRSGWKGCLEGKDTTTIVKELNEVLK